MTIDQKDLKKAVATAIFDPGATEGMKGERTLTEWQVDAVMRAIATLPASDTPFPSHRFDGTKEVPSYTSNSSASASEHAGLVEKVLNLVEELCDAVDAEAEDIGGNRGSLTILRDIGPLIAAAKAEAATALSAGVRVGRDSFDEGWAAAKWYFTKKGISAGVSVNVKTLVSKE